MASFISSSISGLGLSVGLDLALGLRLRRNLDLKFGLGCGFGPGFALQQIHYRSGMRFNFLPSLVRTFQIYSDECICKSSHSCCMYSVPPPSPPLLPRPSPFLTYPMSVGAICIVGAAPAAAKHSPHVLLPHLTR